MKSKRKNIISCFVFILLASFALSFTHTFLEQTGNSCINHEDHDFSKVIVNVVLKDNSYESSALTLVDINYTLDYPVIYSSVTLNESDGYFYNPPLLYSDQLYLNKFRTLLI